MLGMSQPPGRVGDGTSTCGGVGPAGPAQLCPPGPRPRASLLGSPPASSRTAPDSQRTSLWTPREFLCSNVT